MQKTGIDYSGKKFNNKDFSNQNLQYANFRGATLLHCNFTNCDLRYANFTSANCFGSNFTDSNLARANMMDCNLQRTIFDPADCFGLTITMKCETFTDMEVGRRWLQVWLYMPAQMKLPELTPQQKVNNEKSWLDRIIIILGEKTYLKYRQIFANRIV